MYDKEETDQSVKKLPSEDSDSENKEWKKDEEQEDKWAIVIKKDTGRKWKEKTCSQRLSTLMVVLLKLCILCGVLYIFICSLGLLGDAFKLLGGKKAGEAFHSNEVLSNPIADLMIGVLVTVLLQSSSTTTSIVVAMVANEALPVGPAIFVIMGANIGTSVTNTIVSMGHVYDRNEYRRAFAGATVHDMFNWLNVLVLLPVEWISKSIGPWGVQQCGLLCQITERIVKSAEAGKTTNPELLKKITKPFTHSIILVDKHVVETIAKNPDLAAGNLTMVKAYQCVRQEPYAESINGTCMLLSREHTDAACGFLFESISVGRPDWEIGIYVLILSLAMLTLSLVAVVKLLNSMLKGPAARIIQKFMNAKIPHPFGWLTGYIAILLGTGITILVQSSSIFTSTLTPLVGTGVLHIKRMYPLTLGANIGTTFTAILASLAIGDGFERSMQVALCHFFFNILGVIIWYPVPAMRNVPISLAKGLGNTTAKHRWFALMYILVLFFCFPAAVFGLSVAGWKASVGVLVPLFGIFAIVVIINVMQRKCPQRVTPKLRNWNWLPRPLHTLSFYDGACNRCKMCRNERPKENVISPPTYEDSADVESSGGCANQACTSDDGVATAETCRL